MVTFFQQIHFIPGLTKHYRALMFLGHNGQDPARKAKPFGVGTGYISLVHIKAYVKHAVH